MIRISWDELSDLQVIYLKLNIIVTGMIVNKIMLFNLEISGSLYDRDAVTILIEVLTLCFSKNY